MRQELNDKRDDINEVLSTAKELGAQFADIRLETSEGTLISVKDGKTKISSSNELGAGIRSFLKGAWGFAYTTQIDIKGLMECAKSAVKLSKALYKRAEKFSIDVPVFDDKVRTNVTFDPTSVPISDKLEYSLTAG